MGTRIEDNLPCCAGGRLSRQTPPTWRLTHKNLADHTQTHGAFSLILQSGRSAHQQQEEEHIFLWKRKENKFVHQLLFGNRVIIGNSRTHGNGVLYIRRFSIFFDTGTFCVPSTLFYFWVSPFQSNEDIKTYSRFFEKISADWISVGNRNIRNRRRDVHSFFVFKS